MFVYGWLYIVFTYRKYGVFSRFRVEVDVDDLKVLFDVGCVCFVFV